MAGRHVDAPAAEALLDLLRSNAHLTVYDGEVPNEARPPYALVYFAGGHEVGDNLGGRSTEATMRAYVHAVAETAAGTRAIAGQVSATILDQVLVVPGWSCGPIRREASPPPTSDKVSTGENVMDKRDVYTWRLVAA